MKKSILAILSLYIPRRFPDLANELGTLSKTRRYLEQEKALSGFALKLGFWVNPDDRSAFLDWLKNNDEAAPGFETRIRTKCGEELDMVAHGEHVEVGGEVMLFMVFHDVTANKRAEKARRESQELLDS